MLSARIYNSIAESFVGKVALLTSGSAAGQLVLLLSYPLITRLYTPQDLGVMSVFQAALSMLVVVSAWRYNASIPVPES